MKYIKEYYDYNAYGKKWKLSLKEPDFFVCLKKVGMPEDKILYWKALYKFGTFWNYLKGKHVEYIILQQSPKNYFTWSSFQPYSLQDDASYEYMGELKATPEEIEEWIEEEEAKEMAKKYNL
jgi:hypothetical protein